MDQLDSLTHNQEGLLSTETLRVAKALHQESLVFNDLHPSNKSEEIVDESERIKKIQ
jgi:hypothetical protein